MGWDGMGWSGGTVGRGSSAARRGDDGMSAAGQAADENHAPAPRSAPVAMSVAVGMADIVWHVVVFTLGTSFQATRVVST